jgi:hypothetical protein
MQSKMVEYTELMTKFSALKEKECAVMTQTGGKKERKQMLLQLKENHTLSKEEHIELEVIAKEDYIEQCYTGNMFHIEKRKTLDMERAEDQYKSAFTNAEDQYKNAIIDAKATFDALIAKAEASRNVTMSKAEASRNVTMSKAIQTYTTASEHYKTQRGQSLSTLQRETETLKRKIEEKKEKLQIEKSTNAKTATEMNIEAQKRDLLTKMQAIIDTLQMSRNQAPLVDQDKLPVVPVLPETIVSHYTPPQTMSPAVKEIHDMEEKNSALREEFRMKRRERDRADREREREESARKPTVYGFVHELEGRPYVKPCYNPPIPDYEEVPKTPCDYFTKVEE